MLPRMLQTNKCCNLRTYATPAATETLNMGVGHHEQLKAWHASESILRVEQDCRLTSFHAAWLMIIGNHAGDQQCQVQYPMGFQVGCSPCIFGICFHAFPTSSCLSMSSKAQHSRHAMLHRVGTQQELLRCRTHRSLDFFDYQTYHAASCHPNLAYQ